jgi:outer membrane protein OmpA-like peptidoglycan-associated protein
MFKCLRWILSFIIMSLLLVGCASQRPIAPLNATETPSELTVGQPAREVDNPSAEKPMITTLSQPAEVEKELKLLTEAGSAIEPTPVTKAEPVPENASVALNVRFDSGKAIIKPKYHHDMKRIADFMIQYPSTVAVIEGHTDNVGKDTVNVKLSHRRAVNIKAYLADNFAIDGSRIRVIGYDYQKPVASNKTAAGRQKNRRGETRIEYNVSPNRLYSFMDDSDLPKGGFSIVNQETIDAKIKSYKEKHGAGSYSSRTVDGSTLELYAMWKGIFSHCAIRVETDPHSFYQTELQTLSDLKKAGIKDFHKIGAIINLMGVTVDQFDIVEFIDKKERMKLDHSEPNYAAMPICIKKGSDKRSAQWYGDCLSRYARSYNPENALKAGTRLKVFDYNPTMHNCCNFAEEALEACGLAHCFDLGKSAGLHSQAGLLEE